MGNKLRPENKRACQCVYMSILQLGSAALSKEDNWLCVATVRAIDVATCPGGMAQVMRNLLLQMFGQAPNLHFSGITLDLHSGKSFRLVANFDCMLGDESALHAVWRCKGSGGVKCCMQCMNILNNNILLSQHLEGAVFLKEFTQVRSLEGCVKHTKATILSIVDRLQDASQEVDSGTLRKYMLTQMETDLGWNHCRHNLLLHPTLRQVVDPTAQNCYDWCHNILQGMFQWVLYSVVYALSKSKIKPAHLHASLLQYRFPKRAESKRVTGVDMFNPKRSSGSWEAKTWRCQASEALSIHPVVAHYLHTEVMAKGLHVAECKCFIQMSTMIHMLWHGPKLNIPENAVSRSVEAFLESYVECWGTSGMFWKFHGILHHSEAVRKYGFSPNTLALERKHKSVLKWAEQHQATTHTVIREVLSRSLFALHEAPWLDTSVGLVNPSVARGKYKDFLDSAMGDTLRHMVAGKCRFNKYDVAMNGDYCAVQAGNSWILVQVFFFASTEGVPYLAGQKYKRLSCGKWHSVWEQDGDAELWDVDDILEVLIYKILDRGIQVLHPLRLVA